MTNKAKNELRKLMKKGFSVDGATNIVRNKFKSIKPNTLRNMAYWLRKDEGIGLSVSKKRLSTLHEQLKSRYKRKFDKRGYIVLDKQNEIRRFMKELGSTHVDNPDLVALHPKLFRILADRIYGSKSVDSSISMTIRKNDLTPVEIVEREKGRGTLISQLERYSQIGKLIIVLPVDTRNIEFVGLQAINIRKR